MGGTESTEVTAGIWGFLVFFGLALACWFLFRSMNAHLRRMRYAEREQMLAGEGGFTKEHNAPAIDSASGADEDPIGASERAPRQR